MKLRLFKYKYLPYEKRFLENEIQKMGGIIVSEDENEIEVNNLSIERAKLLTYVESVIDNETEISTIQSSREVINGRTLTKTQSTRYGPHGLHDYKGKFNPQMPRTLLIQNFTEDDTILDPFMGSGTTVIEARDLNMQAYGVELNPFAFSVSSSKLLFEELDELPQFTLEKGTIKAEDYHPAAEYLKKWFTEHQLDELIKLLSSIDGHGGAAKPIMRVVLSDQIRNNSLQDPRDLRIRRLKEVPSNSNLISDFTTRYDHLRNVHERWLLLNGKKTMSARIFNGDSTRLYEYIDKSISGTVCSPPYFSALPYIDTYRLSMVALGLIRPSDIAKEERKLIGARDITMTEKRVEQDYLSTLPIYVVELVDRITELLAMDKTAGFRKQAIPFNLIRYCRLMKNVLSSLYRVEKKGAYNLWVVGPNRATLCGLDIIIDTPEIIAEIAKSVGFRDCELEAVDAYSRFDIHSKNSIRKETVVKFRK